MPFTKKRFKFPEIIILIAIFAAGLFLYFYKLDSIPSGFYIDESTPAYNANSILLTGKDEYGKSFPVLFRAIGSYTPPLFIYSLVPFIKIFGLSIFSVRLTAVLFGLLSMFPIYFLLTNTDLIKRRASTYIGIFLFVISPWILLYSRAGYEVSLGFSLFTLGVCFVWFGLRKPFLLILGFGVLSLSTYAATPGRLLVPIFLISFILLFRVKILKKTRSLFWAILVAISIQTPYLSILGTPAFFLKKNLLAIQNVATQAGKVSNLLPQSFSFILAYLREFLSQYAGYFSPRSLFFLPDPDPQRSIPELSVFYFWMIIPYIFGIFALWKTRKMDFSKFMILLIAVSPIPASLASDPFSTHRSITLLLPLIVVISIGLDRIIQSLPKKVWVSGLGFLLVFSLLLLWRSYFVFLPKERAKVWGYGFEQLANQIRLRPKEKFVIDQLRIKPAYIELAFFLRYPPGKFQQEVDQKIKENYYTDIIFSPEYNFANIETRTINWEEDIYRDQILVGDELAISEGQAKEHSLTKIFEIRDPLDRVIFQGFKTNPKQKCTSIAYSNLHCRGLRG